MQRPWQRCTRQVSITVNAYLYYRGGCPEGHALFQGFTLVDLAQSVSLTLPENGAELDWSGCWRMQAHLLRKQLKLVCLYSLGSFSSGKFAAFGLA